MSLADDTSNRPFPDLAADAQAYGAVDLRDLHGAAPEPVCPHGVWPAGLCPECQGLTHTGQVSTTKQAERDRLLREAEAHLRAAEQATFHLFALDPGPPARDTLVGRDILRKLLQARVDLVGHFTPSTRRGGALPRP